MASIVAALKHKIANLTKTYNDVKQATEQRSSALQKTLNVSEDFWSGLDEVKEKLSDVKGTLDVQDKPALDPETIKRQQLELEVCRISRNISGSCFLWTKSFTSLFFSGITEYAS